MATEAPTAVNGTEPKSLAAMLAEQHTRDEVHKVTVEDVIDEEDLKHSSQPIIKSPEPVIDSSSESAIPAENRFPVPAPVKAPKKAPAFDVRSEELFPALGSGPKPTTPAAATWGAKPSAASALANGLPAQTMS